MFPAGQYRAAGDPGTLAWGQPSPGTAVDRAVLSRILLCPPFPRDYFIICPVIDMASHWARTARGNVFMYHAPESYSHGR